jgi:hypothetical protein
MHGKMTAGNQPDTYQDLFDTGFALCLAEPFTLLKIEEQSDLNLKGQYESVFCRMSKLKLWFFL